jgi:RNA polymerase sigma-70 factor (ECF subfamily)
VARASRNERDFERLFERYYRPVVHFFGNRDFSIVESRELARETFLGAYKTLGRSHRGADEALWLLTLAGEAWRQRLRGHSTGSHRTAAPGVRRESSSTIPTIGRGQLLRRALEELPSSLRHALHLHEEQGLTAPEVAAVLQVSVDTVDSQLSQAREHLAPHLEDTPSAEDGLREVLDWIALEVRREASPRPDELLAYHRGELDDSEREALHNHLAVCPRCARTVLDLALFPAIEPLVPRPGDEPDLEAELSAVRDRLLREGAVRRSALARLPLVAGLLLVLAAGLWVHRESTLSIQPRKNPRSLELPDIATGEGQPLDFTGDSPRRTLEILGVRGEHTDYEIEIVDSEGRVLYREDGFERDAALGITLDLHRDFLGEGTYVLRLYGVRRGAAEELRVYRLRVGTPPTRP